MWFLYFLFSSLFNVAVMTCRQCIEDEITSYTNAGIL